MSEPAPPMITHPSASVPSLTHRHALRLALIYLLIRGFPDLLLWCWLMMPDPMKQFLAESPVSWALWVLPPQTLGLYHAVPIAFQYALNSWFLLLTEVLLAFLFGVWMLKRRPWAADRRAQRKAWVVLALATLGWSLVLRHLLLGELIERQVALLQADMSYDTLTTVIWQFYWQALPLFFLSVPVWAGLPVWLHFRALGRRPDAVVPVAMAQSLKRGCVLAGFVLGFILLHYAMMQGLGMGLWAWAVDTRDVFIPTDQLNEMGVPLIFSQVVAPTLFAIVAACLYSRNAHAQTDSGFQLVVGPVLAGIAVLALVNMICATLAWLVFYLDYGLASGLLLGMAYHSASGYVGLVVFNVSSLILLCGLTVFLRGPRLDAGSHPPYCASP